MDANIDLTHTAIAPAAGGGGGILADPLDMGRGIVMVPTLYFALSVTEMEQGRIMQLAVGTSLVTIIVTSLSSAWGYYPRGAVDTKLLKLCAPSILIGVGLGGVGGGLIDSRVLISVSATVAALVAVDMVLRKTGFGATERSFSRPAWAILGYNIHRAVGTASATGFVISVPGAITYAVSGLGANSLPLVSRVYVNSLAVPLIITLTTSFARVGVRIADATPKRALRLAFDLFLGSTSIRMFADRADALT